MSGNLHETVTQLLSREALYALKILEFASRHEPIAAAIAAAILEADEELRCDYEAGVALAREIDAQLKYQRSQRASEQRKPPKLRLV